MIINTIGGGGSGGGSGVDGLTLLKSTEFNLTGLSNSSGNNNTAMNQYGTNILYNATNDMDAFFSYNLLYLRVVIDSVSFQAYGTGTTYTPYILINRTSSSQGWTWVGSYTDGDYKAPIIFNLAKGSTATYSATNKVAGHAFYRTGLIENATYDNVYACWGPGHNTASMELAVSSYSPLSSTNNFSLGYSLSYMKNGALKGRVQVYGGNTVFM